MQISDFLIGENATLIEALKRIDDTGWHCVFVVNDEGKLVASLADGDIRRFILLHGTSKGFVNQAANYKPYTVQKGCENEAVKLIQENGITVVPVLDQKGCPIDVVLGKESLKRKIRQLERPLPVVMMAGGVGSRLMPITAVLPKPLVPINEKPIAEHIIDRFCEAGCDEFYLVLNYKKGMVKAYFDDLEKDYSVTYLDEKEYLGTGGGLKLAEPYLHSPFFLTNCDVLIDADLQSIFEEHRRSGNAVTIVCSLKHYTIPYGSIEINEGGGIREMSEKPTISSLVNTGLYLVEPSVLSFIGDSESIGFPDVVVLCQEAGMKVGVFPISEGSWLDMGQPEELKRMEEVLARGERLDG